jgi:hypothetical protein
MDDAAISVLKATFETANRWAGISALAVATGVFIELIVLFIFSKEIGKLEKAVLIIATAGIALGVLGEWWYGSEAATASENLQSDATTKAANAIRDASHADERAANLEKEAAAAKERATTLELRIKELEPRNLNWTAFVNALRNVPRCPVEILYLADDFDSMSLAQQIGLAIKAGGWDEPSRKSIERPSGWDGPTPMAVDGQPTGVTVVAHIGEGTEEITAARGVITNTARGNASFDTIQRALLVGLGKVATWVNGPHAPPNGTLRIVVAPRE